MNLGGNNSRRDNDAYSDNGGIKMDTLPLEEGDIIGLAPKGIERLFPPLISPRVNTHHHVLLGAYIPDEEDWVIYESLYSGVHIGRLSWYKDQKLRVYRVDPHLGVRAVLNVTKYGRKGYDFLIYIRLLLNAFGYWIRNGLCPVPFFYLRDVPNNQLLCTELITKAYRPYLIIADGVAATPAAFEQSHLDGAISLVYEGMLSELFHLHDLEYRGR
jgi:hypothetical protein